MEEKQILCVGLVVLDIINVMDKYPEEDTDSRCLSQRWQRGGNASNSCTVLSLLGAPCAFMGSLAPGHVADFLAADFRQRGVDVSQVAWQSRGETPCSCCIVNNSNGSRTIVLYDTNLPDVSAKDFEKVELTRFKWIHIEGRNASEQVKMLQRIEQHNARQPPEGKIQVSVEVEKPREELYQLFGYGDVVFVSKDVAKHFGFRSAEEALRGLYSRVRKGATLVCAWAEEGADALGPDGRLLHSDAFPPPRVVDTLGAGDTFNAAVIFSLSQGDPGSIPGLGRSPGEGKGTPVFWPGEFHGPYGVAKNRTRLSNFHFHLGLLYRLQELPSGLCLSSSCFSRTQGFMCFLSRWAFSQQRLHPNILWL